MVVCDDRANRVAFLRGVQLFNRGKFFESHEVWEALWRQSTGLERELLQGLIQAAAALIQLERGKLAGARSLMRRARQRLGGLPAGYGRVAIAEFCAALEAHLIAVLVGQPSLLPQLVRRKPGAGLTRLRVGKTAQLRGKPASGGEP